MTPDTLAVWVGMGMNAIALIAGGAVIIRMVREHEKIIHSQPDGLRARWHDMNNWRMRKDGEIANMASDIAEVKADVKALLYHSGSHTREKA